MGAQSFTDSIIGLNAKECYERLTESSTEEYGHDIYNGTISTCDLGRCTLKFDKYLKSNEKKAYKHIEDRHSGDKWVADYVDLGVVEYELLTVKKEKKEYTAKYKMQYVILERELFKYEKTEYSFEKPKDAENKAIQLSLNNPNKKYRVSKEYVLEQGNNVNFDLIVERKKYASKPSLKLKPNQKLIEKHKYIFYGWAAC